MAAEIIVSYRSSGKLLSHIVFYPLLDSIPDLSATFVASFFAAFQQKAFRLLKFLQFGSFSLALEQSESVIVLVLSQHQKVHYLTQLARQVLVYANQGQYSLIETEMNQINTRALRQLVKYLKKISFVNGVCLFVKDLGLEIEENYRGGYIQKEWEDLKESEMMEKWLGQEYMLYNNEYLLTIQFDKNAIFGNMADVEITRGGNIAGFDGFNAVKSWIYAMLGDIECCIDRIV